MAISYANNDWLQTLQAVNANSPNPNYAAGDTTHRNATGIGMGLTPDQISGRFDAGYDTGVGKFDPFPGDHSKIDQLQNLYGTVPQAYDVSDTLASIGATRKANLLGGEQAANTAATKFQTSQIPGAATGAGASMLRAQALLPFLQADTGAAADQGKYADSAKQGALSAASSIATTLAQLQQDYTNSLASYNTSKANFGLAYGGQQSDLALKASQSNAANQLEMFKSNAQIAENARATNLNAALQTQQMNQQGQQTANSQQIQAAEGYLAGVKAPSGGSWQTDNTGKVVSGQNDYDAYQTYLRNRATAQGSLASKF